MRPFPGFLLATAVGVLAASGCLVPDIGSRQVLEQIQGPVQEGNFGDAAAQLEALAQQHRGHPQAEQLMWAAASLSWQALLAEQPHPTEGIWEGTLQRWERDCEEWPRSSFLRLELRGDSIEASMDFTREQFSLRGYGSRTEAATIVARQGGTCGLMSLQIVPAANPSDGGAALEAWIGYEVVTLETSTNCPPLCSWAGVAQLSPAE